MRPHHLIGGGMGIIVPWGIVTISTLNTWPERVHETLIGAAICITVCIGIGFIAVGNRHYYDKHLDILRTEVYAAIKAGKFGQLLDRAGIPYRPAVPGGHVTSVPIPGEDAIAGFCDGAVIDIDAARDAMRHTDS